VLRYPGVRTFLGGLVLFGLVVVAAMTGMAGDLVIDGTAPNPILFGTAAVAVLVTAAGLLRIVIEFALRLPRR
jgi:hypothetical protein